MAAGVWECVGARLMELCRTKCQLSEQEAPTGADDGIWGVGVRWRTADGAMSRLSVNEVRRRLLDLGMAPGVMECVGTRLMEL